MFTNLPFGIPTQVLKRSGTDAEKRYAARIIPVIANEHFLLVTLLLCNAAAAEVGWGAVGL
jgi:metal transporter CNNM